MRREEAGKPARARPLPRGLQVESAEVAAAAAAAASLRGPRALAWSARCLRTRRQGPRLARRSGAAPPRLVHG